MEILKLLQSIFLIRQCFGDWFSTNTDTTDLNDGLIFRPTNSNIIKGFYSFNASDTSVQPTLICYLYRYKWQFLNSYSHKVGFSKYVSTVNQASLITDNNLIYVQNGISYRGLVSFDSIPIPMACIDLSCGSASDFKFISILPQITPFTHDSMYAFSVGTNDKSDGGSYALSQRSDSSGRPVYSFEIRQIALRMLE